MTVTVGTDVFASVATADAFFLKRSNTAWGLLNTEQKEALLVKASDTLERTFRWRGKKANAAQRLGWPDRLEAYDDEDEPLPSMPWQVEEACCLTAEQIRAGVDVEGVQTTDAVVQSEKVDVITIVYDTSERQRGPAVLTHVIQLLDAVTLGDQLLRS